MSTPVRGRRHRGTPSLVLPDDPDGCGWEAAGNGRYRPVSLVGSASGHLNNRYIQARYGGRPSYWGNPWQATNENGFWQHHVAGEPKPRTFRYQDETAALKWAAIQHESWITGLGPIDQAQYVAPLVTADVLSCWCPLEDADGNTHPCHADILCTLIGQLKSGELVPGLVATSDVGGGALCIADSECTVGEVMRTADEMRREYNAEDIHVVARLSADFGVSPDLVRLAAQVGGGAL